MRAASTCSRLGLISSTAFLKNGSQAIVRRSPAATPRSAVPILQPVKWAGEDSWPAPLYHHGRTDRATGVLTSPIRDASVRCLCLTLDWLTSSLQFRHASLVAN